MTPNIQSPILSLLVLRSQDIESAKDFYTLLGLAFAAEKHGNGPRHYSAKVGALVLEIYPPDDNDSWMPLRIGFQVPHLDHTLDLLRSRGERIIQEAKDSPWGRRAVVEDPDGNRVELMSMGTSAPGSERANSLQSASFRTGSK